MAALVCVVALASCASDVEFRSGPVVVEVFDDEGREANGAQVLLHDARGRLLARPTTDVTGTVVFDAAGPLTVTLLSADFTSTTLRTLFDVKPDTTVRFGTRIERTEGIGEIVLALPPRPHDGWYYVLDTPCVRRGQPVSTIPHQEYRLDPDTGCLGADGTMSAQVEAYSFDADLDGLPDYLTATHVIDVPVSADERTVIAMPMWDPELEQQELQLVDAPAGMLVVMEFRYLLAEESFLYGDEDGGVEATETGAGLYRRGFTRPAAHADAYGLAMRVFWPLTTETLGYESLYVQRTTDLGAQPSVSFADLPPRFAKTTFTESWPPRFTWRNGDGRAPAANRLHLAWSDNRAGTWDLVLGPGRGLIDLPTLPDDLAFLGPNEDTVFDNRLLGTIETDVLEDWTEYFRYEPLFTFNTDTARARLMPPEYNVRITQFEIH